MKPLHAVIAPTHCCYECGEWFDTLQAGPEEWLVKPYGSDLSKTWQVLAPVPICPFDATNLQPWLIDAEP